ncbi:hypothetical protein BCR36DRAFT_254909, partial [Piromyces finnis]
YYCKNDLCTVYEPYQGKYFVEFDNDNGTIYRYILGYYGDFYNKSNLNYIETINNETVHVYIGCKTDNQCFSNKCVNNICEFNDEANIERCDTLYIKSNFFSQRPKHYTHCGRFPYFSCTKNEECSFNTYNGGECNSGRD